MKDLEQRRGFHRVKRFVTVTLFLSAVVLLAGVCQAQESITKDKLKELLGKPGVYIIDIRTEKEWGRTQIKLPGANHEMRGQLTTWEKKYPQDGTIIVY